MEKMKLMLQVISRADIYLTHLHVRHCTNPCVFFVTVVGLIVIM